MNLLILVTLAIPTLVAGQDYGAPAPAATTTAAAAIPTATAGQHIIQVAMSNGLMFTPTTVTASVNDTVTFVFSPDTTFNHSVTQSTFANPCTPVQGGFNSGLQPPSSEFSITVTNATSPIWFFCEQTTPLKHCGMGMVGAINPPSSGNTFSSFSANALGVGNNEGAQTGSPALSGIGAFASASASPLPKATGGNGASRISLGAGTALAAAMVAALSTLA